MLVIANILFQERQEMMLHMDITKWSVLKSDSLYSLQLKIEKLYAAAAKSLQSCPTLCDPIDGSPPGSHLWDSPGKNTRVGCHCLLQCMEVKGKSLSCVRLFTTPRTAAHQAPLSMGFSRQEYWSGVPSPSPLWHYAAKSFQLCPTLFDPIDGSPPGSTIPGILQARTLEWVAISFSNAGK